MDHNQDPDFYSKEYFLQQCAGNSDFNYGQESAHQLYSYIFDNMGIDCKDKKVLDLGFGRGELCLSSLRKGARKVTGIDFSKSAVDIANENLKESHNIDQTKIEFLHGNALELNLNEKFDIIYLTDIIEHLYDDQNQILFKKVKEHLSEDGVIVIHTMPTKEFIIFGQFIKMILYLFKRKKFHLLTFKNQAEITHVNLFHKEQLQKHLQNFEHNVWYDFSQNSTLKNIIRKTPLIRLFSSNLWATAKLKK